MTMRTWTLAGLVPLLIAGCSGDPDSQGADVTAQSPFPDSLDTLQSDWQTYSKYTFKLSQAYPTRKPTSVLPWASIDPLTDPDAYLLALRKYLYDGMIHADDPDADFRPEFNKVRRWYHVPWLHPGARGREAIHGLTRERDAAAKTFAPTQTSAVQDWGVAFYNNIGGFAVGSVWKNHTAPDATKATFNEGACVFKMLFTTASTKSVPWLEGDAVWKANVSSTISLGSTRRISEVRLLQMDVAVRDSRSKGGWIYGTFVYDQNATSDAKYGAYGKMMPVGLAIGNDPTVLPGGMLAETKLATAIPEVAKSRLGWGGRMNGPADNPSSACLSCHLTSEWQPMASMTPPPSLSDQDKLRWFRNLPASEAWDTGQTPLGTSLQLQISLRNFFEANPSSKALGACKTGDCGEELYDTPWDPR